jgi:hypothetical protein
MVKGLASLSLSLSASQSCVARRALLQTRACPLKLHGATRMHRAQSGTSGARSTFVYGILYWWPALNRSTRQSTIMAMPLRLQSRRLHHHHGMLSRRSTPAGASPWTSW